MIQTAQQERARLLIEKVRSLSSEKLDEVLDFIEFLHEREERLLTRAAARLSEPTLQKIWNNPDDEISLRPSSL